MSEADKMQTISNGVLVNHRYGRTEDDFAGNSLTVITPTGIQKNLYIVICGRVIRDINSFTWIVVQNI
jgi:hypothetical protein